MNGILQKKRASQKTKHINENWRDKSDCWKKVYSLWEASQAARLLGILQFLEKNPHFRQYIKRTMCYNLFVFCLWDISIFLVSWKVVYSLITPRRVECINGIFTWSASCEVIFVRSTISLKIPHPVNACFLIIFFFSCQINRIFSFSITIHNRSLLRSKCYYYSSNKSLYYFKIVIPPRT